LADGAVDFAAVDRSDFCMKLLIKLKNGWMQIYFYI